MTRVTQKEYNVWNPFFYEAIEESSSLKACDESDGTAASLLQDLQVFSRLQTFLPMQLKAEGE